MKVEPCRTSNWDHIQHGLDLPYPVTTVDFRIRGRGHQRLGEIYRTYCDRSRYTFEKDQTMPEDRIAGWLCRNCASFVLIETATVRYTTISFMHEDDAEAFAREFT